MPRTTDPGTLTLGSGLAASESIEANALIHPVDDAVRVHIIDPSRAHQARAIHVVDSAGLFVSDHVEGCLAELAGGTAAYSSNGLISGGTYTVAAGVLTLDPGTTALINGNAVDFSGFSVALPPLTVDFWVYIDSSTSTLVWNAGAPPVALEHIPIARLTTDAIPAVTNATDARYFVYNMDRKLPYTVRNSGSDPNRHSEANFESMDAAFLWLETYWPTNESERAILVVRGQEVITTNLSVPITNLVIEGEGGGSLIAGAPLTAMIELNGKNRVTIKNMLLLCDVPGAGSVAVGNLTGASAQDFRMENCKILSSGGDWAFGIQFITAACPRTIIEGCRIQATQEGFHTDLPLVERIVDCVVENPLGNVASSRGISIGETGFPVALNEGKSIVRGCDIEGFDIGIFLKGAFCTANDNRLRDPITGMLVDGQVCMVKDNHIIMVGANGLYGLNLIAGSGHKVQGNYITNTRTTGYGANLPRGIWVQGVDNAFLDNNHIEGFWSDSNPSYGIYLGTGATGAQINGGAASGSEIGILVDSGTGPTLITGVNLTENVSGFSLLGDGVIIQGCRVDLNGTTGLNGVIGFGSAYKIKESFFTLSRAWAGLGENPRGVWLSNSDDTNVEGCTFDGFYNTADALGAGIFVGSGSNRVQIIGNVFKDNLYGVNAENSAHNHLIVSNNICRGNYHGIVLSDTAGVQCHTAKILGNTIENLGNFGWGIGVVGYRDFEVSGNTVDGDDGTAGVGIYVSGQDVSNLRTRRFVMSDNNLRSFQQHGIEIRGYCQNGTITGNQIDNAIGFNTQVVANGIYVHDAGAGALPQYLTINGNTIWNSIRGIIIEGASGNQPTRMTIDGNVLHHIARDIAPGDTFDGHGGVAIGLNQVADAIVSNNQIRNLGLMINTNDSQFSPAGPNFSVHGVLCLNAGGVTVSGNNMRRLVKGGSGLGRGIAVRQRDNSGAVTNRSFNLTGNTIWDTAGTMNAMIFVQPADNLAAGIQRIDGIIIDGNNTRNGDNSVYVDMGNTSAITGLTISNNVCDEPDLAGVNVDAVGDQVNLIGVSITGNTVNAPGFGGLGVNAAVLTSGIIKDVTFAGNTVNNSGGIGISVAALNTAGGSTVSYQNVTVSGNAINSPAGNAIALNVGGGGSGSTLHNASITGNAIYLGGAIGIDVLALYLGGGVGQADVMGCSITGNTIELTSGSGVRVTSGSETSDIRDLLVTNNSIQQASTYGVFCSVVVGGTIENLAINDNAISEVDLAGVAVGNLLNGTLRSIHVNDNQIRDSLANGIEFAVADGDLLSVQVCNNTLENLGSVGAGAAQGLGIAFLAGNGSTNNVQINDNTVVNAATMGIAVGGFELVVQATATITLSSTIAGNSVTIDGTPIGGVGPVLLTGISPGPAGPGQFEIGGTDVVTAQNLAAAINDAANGLNGTVTATNNGTVVTITAVPIGAAGNGATLIENTGGTTIVVTTPTSGGVGGAGANSNNSRYEICRNILQNPKESGIIVLTFDGTIRQFTISDNIINQPGVGAGISATRGAGILLGAVSTSGVTFDRVNMTGNRMTWNGGDTGANAAYGIGLLAYDCNISNVMISDCQIENSPATGIFVGTIASSGGLLNSIDISDCSVRCQATAANAATFPHYGVAMLMAASSPGAPHQTLTIQGCKLRSSSANVAAAAAAIIAFPWGSSDGGKLRAVHVSDNILENSYNGFIWSSFVGAGGIYSGSAPVMSGIVISDNIVRSCSGLAISSLMTAASLESPPSSIRRVEDVQITGNTIYECALISASNIVIGVDWPLPTMNVRVDGNSIRGCGNVAGVAAALTAGISMTVGVGSGADVGLTNLSICDNQLQDNYGSGILAGHTIFNAGTDTSVRNVEVSRNSLRSLTEGGIGLGFTVVSGALLNISVCDNNVNNIDGAFGAGLGHAIIVTFEDQVAECIEISRNKLKTIADSAIVVTHNANFNSLQIDGNTIDGVITSHGITLDPSTGALFSASVSHNQLTNIGTTGIRIGTTMEVDSLIVHGNTFDTVGGNGINVDTNVSGRNLQVTNNIVRNATNAAIRVEWNDLFGTTVAEGVTVSNNEVYAGSGAGIWVNLEDNRNVRVEGNQVTSTSGKGIDLDAEDTFSMSISGNVLFGTDQTAIEATFGGSDTIRSLHVDNNRITTVGVGGVANDAYGIYLNMTNADDFSGVHVCGNSVWNTLGTGQRTGIYVRTPDTTTSIPQGLHVCDNTVDSADQLGIHVYFQDDCELIDISGNTSTANGGTHIYIQSTGAGAEHFYSTTVCRNRVMGGSGSGIQFDLNRTIHDLIVMENIARFCNIGIRCQFDGTGIAINFSHNSSRGSSAADTLIAGTAIPNGGGAPVGDGWICVNNTAQDASAGGGWGTSTLLNSFCHRWDRTTGNQDSVA